MLPGKLSVSKYSLVPLCRHRAVSLQAVLGDNAEALIAHFVEYGMSEGRQASADFNAYSYKDKYEDLRNIFGEDMKAYYVHYINYGQAEGREGV